MDDTSPPLPCSGLSIQSATDRRSLIGNEPWSHSLSQDQQIATTYPLWRGCSPSHPSIISASLSLSLPLPFSLFLPILKRLWPWVAIYQASVRVMATVCAGVFYRCRCVKNPTYSIPVHLQRTCPSHGQLCHLRNATSSLRSQKWTPIYNVMASFLDRGERGIDFQRPPVTFLSISGCY